MPGTLHTGAPFPLVRPRTPRCQIYVPEDEQTLRGYAFA